MTCNQIVNSSGPVSEEDCEGAIDYQNGGPIPGTQTSLPVNNAVTSAVETTLAVAGMAATEALGVYSLGWQNFGSAWSIYWNSNATYGQRFSAGLYMGAWGGAHVMFGLGVAGLVCAAAGPGCVAAVEGILGIGTAISADGDPTNEIVVLGRYPEYLKIADDIGGKTFNVSEVVWNALSRAEQWALNQHFLDEAIANGNTFYLASKWSEAVTGTFYRMELEYLFSQGYTLSTYQNFLIPPFP